ncbi:histidine kinase [uncultured Bacteroides sp.]|uniref:sensor histidine kinase n=1 Tax=uncultured Bacteroides sp. TaxID=162156 RepID=UPI002AA85478|nr:histidine kinase [uncultured Bacteroides sp.]
MMKLQKRHLLENIIYAAIWLIAFLLPIIGNHFSFYSEKWYPFNWNMIWGLWLSILPFFVIFIINNYFLAPFLLFRKKYITYTLSVICVVLIILGVYSFVPHHPGNFQGDRMPKRIEKPSWQRMSPNVSSSKINELTETLDDDIEPKKPMEGKPFPFPGIMMMGPFYSRFIIAILVVGFNIAIKLLFKSLRDEETMKELERHNLQSELEYLKYQINPHFFMNTLNNIHALVDIDAEKAKKTIVELSKMMRYVLYESSNKTILLSREIRFLNNYIGLMRLRYTEKVNIEVTMPTYFPEVQIPPLLFISFVENAFKHGVSYQTDSFIHVHMRLEGEQLLFQCSNSNWKKQDEQHRGIGLENIRKRLKLLFGDDYMLSIDEVAESFNVLLIIPIVYD